MSFSDSLLYRGGMRKELLAYRNLDFLESPDGRILRVISEYFEPMARLKKNDVKDLIVIFGSARVDPSKEPKGQNEEMMHRYYEDCRQLSEKLTEWRLKKLADKSRFVICSGGSGGMMEAANKGAHDAGGRTVGLGIKLPSEQGLNEYVSEDLTFEFRYFFMRKYWFVSLAKAFIIFPGGFGTLDEFFETLTLIQTGKYHLPGGLNPPVALYGSRYWEQIISAYHMAEWGTISPKDLELFRIFNDPDECLDYITEGLEAQIKLELEMQEKDCSE